MSINEDILKLKEPTFESFVRLSEAELSGDKRQRPWIGLNHGTGILKTEEELCQYLCAYGEIHKEKIYSALRAYSNPQEIYSNKITIIDWGCGQGLATVCFLDFLKDVNVKAEIDKVVLIDASSAAIDRGMYFVYSYLKDLDKIVKVNKYLDDVVASDITSLSPLTIHFFSNILDIEYKVNLEKIASLIKMNKYGKQLLY